MPAGGYWFRRKIYGWGWYPARLQGWLVLAVFLGIIFWNVSSLAAHPVPTSADMIWFFARIALALAALFFICYKTGEKPRWQWGRTSRPQPDEHATAEHEHKEE